MKRFRSLILLLLVLGLGAYIYWVDAERASTPEREEARRRAFSIDLNRLESIHIRRQEYSLGMVRDGEEWRLSSPAGVMANQATVRQTLSRLQALSRGEMITPGDMRERGQTLADFGLAVPVAVLTLEDARGRREYRIGNPNPLGNALYVKEASSQNVMLISSDLMDILPLRADAFRDRRILGQSPGAVRALSLHAPGRLVRLEYQGDHWVLNEPFRFPARQERVEGMLQQLDAARIERFLLPEEISGEPFDREGEVVTLRVHFAGSAPTMELEIGNRVPGEPQSRYARFAGQDGIFVVSEGVRSLALTELLAIQTLEILPVAPEHIPGFTVQVPGGSDPIRLVRADGTWRMRSPFTSSAAPEIAELVLEAWTAAVIEERHPLDQAGNLLYTFEVTLASGARSIPTTFEVYTDERNPAATWVRPGGMQELWRIFPDTLRYVPSDPLAFISRNVLRFPAEDVIRLRIRTEDNEITILRENAQSEWNASDENTRVDSEQVGRVLDVFSALQASRLLERGSVNPGAWGLDDPPIHLSLGLGGERPDNRTLRIAKHSEFGMVGMVQGQDVIFVLPESVQKLLNPALLLDGSDSGSPPDDPASSDS